MNSLGALILVVLSSPELVTAFVIVCMVVGGIATEFMGD